MELSDVWDDACLVDVYTYIRKGSVEHVPECWKSELAKLDSELRERGYSL